jgi:D-3-phosphoglycerate dehydrogenase
MNTWRIAAPDSWAPEVREIIEAEVPDGFSLEFAGLNGAGTPEELIASADFLLLGPTKMTAAKLDSAKNARLIHRWGVGYDGIDLEAADRNGIGIAICAGANAHSVAEHTMMLILATLRRLTVADRSLRDGKWITKDMRVQCFQLQNRTVGLIGFGNIGRALARRLQGFECSILYYDPVRAPAEVEAAVNAKWMPFEEVLAKADIVSLHCPGGKANRHMIGADALARMKRGAILINAARGELVDQAALAAALESRKLGGAGLDVFEAEPMEAGNPLLRFDNVTLTPHTAGSVLDNCQRVARHIFRNMQRVASGEPMPPADTIVAPKRHTAAAVK